MRLAAAALAAAALAAAALACSSVPALPGTGHVAGHVTIAPCTPVERFPPSPCPPAAGVKVHFGSSLTATTDSQGDYAADVPPGDYDVYVEVGIYRQPHRIHVNSGDRLTLDLNVDSGIR